MVGDNLQFMNAREMKEIRLAISEGTVQRWIISVSKQMESQTRILQIELD